MLQTTLEGTGRFIKEIAPKSSTMSTDAKDLLLKDVDYSTPTDHYFQHLQKLKNDPEYANKLREDEVLSSLSISKVDIKAAELSQRERELRNMSF